MGGIEGNLELPALKVIFFDITLKGKFQYGREDIILMAKMLNSGVLKLDQVDVVGRFGLDDWEKAFEAASANANMGQIAVMAP